ncbi:MAG: TetR/AcrR family transcriptional regulator [Desulfobacteraceae bacterium]|nr:TetR/AcrR family transcriptional regulator [Desulfobacteraceae bacterium]MBC2754300.1 TetR/AcrR family transcriptional regulator [Desulfobacteraceae bacterium]
MSSVRTPKQQRSIQTKKRIVNAGFHLYAQKGIHGTNSKEIAEKAGVSIGSFYSYFKNKKTLLLEILEDFLDQVYLTIWKEMENVTINELGRNEVKFIIENVFKAYDIAPTFHSQTHALRYSDPDINRAYERERNREVTQIRYLLENNKQRMRVSDQEAAAIVIHNAVESVAHTVKFIGSKIDEQRLINELADMINNFLLHGSQEG